MVPTPREYWSAVFSTFLTSRNLGIVFFSIFLVFVLVRFIKSLLIKLLLVFLVGFLVAGYLYFRTTSHLTF